jgi:hypothetical protein
MAAQRQAIERECQRRGWDLVDIVSDEAVAGGLVVAKIDRLTRGIKDFVGLHDQAQAERWALVMLDVDLDTSTPTGEFTANIQSPGLTLVFVPIFQVAAIPPDERTQGSLAPAPMRTGRPQRVADGHSSVRRSRRRSSVRRSLRCRLPSSDEGILHPLPRADGIWSICRAANTQQSISRLHQYHGPYVRSETSELEASAVIPLSQLLERGRTSCPSVRLTLSIAVAWSATGSPERGHWWS